MPLYGKTKNSASLRDKGGALLDELEPGYDLIVHGRSVNGRLDVTAVSKPPGRDTAQRGWIDAASVEVFHSQPDAPPRRPRKPRIEADDMRVLLITAGLIVLGVSALLWVAFK